MTPEQRKQKLDELGTRLWSVINELDALIPELRFRVDKKAASEIVGRLIWDFENCAVMGQHQIGESLEDNMGVSEDDGGRGMRVE